MPDLKTIEPMGQLQTGWSALIEDYAIAGSWACSDQVFVAGDAAGGIFGFDGDSGRLIWSHSEIHKGGLLSVSSNPKSNSIATSGQDGQILLLDSKDGSLKHTINLGQVWVENLSWSPDGQWLAASGSRKVYIYDTNGKQAWCSEDHPSTVSAIAWSSAQELATACYGQVAFYIISTGQLIQKLEWKGSLVSMVLSPDGQIVVCGSQDNSVHFWRRSNGKDSMMSGYPSKPSALAFDSNGTLLATGGGEAVTVWSFDGEGPEGTKPGILSFHAQPISSLAFSPLKANLASGSRDGSVITWLLQTDGQGEPVGGARLDSKVSELIWKSDGKALAALDANGGITVWRANPKINIIPNS